MGASRLRVNQPGATISQVYYLTFMCRSTCFECLHAHHQELTTALTASGFTLERGGSSVVGRGLAGYHVLPLLHWQTQGGARNGRIVDEWECNGRNEGLYFGEGKQHNYF